MSIHTRLCALSLEGQTNVGRLQGKALVAWGRTRGREAELQKDIYTHVTK